MPNNQLNWRPFLRHVLVFGLGWLALPAIQQFSLPVLLWLYTRWASRELQSVSLIGWALLLGSQLAVLFQWPLGLGMIFVLVLFGGQEWLEGRPGKSKSLAQLLLSLGTTIGFFWPLNLETASLVFLNLLLAGAIVVAEFFWENYA